MKVKVLVDELKKLTKLLEKMTDEVVFVVEDGFIKLRLVNIERTAFAEIGIHADVQEDGKFAIRVKDLKKVVSMFKKEELEFVSEDGFIVVKGEKKKIKIPEIEAEEFDQTLPEFEFEQTMKVDLSEYKQFVKDAKQLGEAVKISGNKLIVVDSQYEYEYEFDDVQGSSEIVVGVRLLELPLVLSVPVYDFKFGSGTPLVVEIDDDFIKGRFVIAPRLSEEV